MSNEYRLKFFHILIMLKNFCCFWVAVLQLYCISILKYSQVFNNKSHTIFVVVGVCLHFKVELSVKKAINLDICYNF